jgi:3-mercaptopyruvate sulfurtransferase SseA
MLRDSGFRAVALKGGFRAWKEAGYAVEAKSVEQEAAAGQLCSVCGRPLSEHIA